MYMILFCLGGPILIWSTSNNWVH
ncbi:unnamed protein product [Psylliodes chrysocephalus]|uniref:Uncharacterized protein n=1 Tax=Psylliodes chrysocephalus TaxID=3402493 RepID=A0A9P0GFY6_9CUCU|nr:unnamed protein product [Psylliodes chrysocephala]